MRVHSRLLTPLDLKLARDVASTATGTRIGMEYTVHASRSHGNAFEVKATGDGSHVTRHTNSGGYGANTEEFALGYAGWGFLISALYDLDPAAVWGTVKNPIYEDKADFYAKTTLSAESEPDPNNVHGRFYGEVIGVVCPFDTDIALVDRRAIYLAFGKRGGMPNNYSKAGRKICRAIVEAVTVAANA